MESFSFCLKHINLSLQPIYLGFFYRLFKGCASYRTTTTTTTPITKTATRTSARGPKTSTWWSRQPQEPQPPGRAQGPLPALKSHGPRSPEGQQGPARRNQRSRWLQRPQGSLRRPQGRPWRPRWLQGPHYQDDHKHHDYGSTVFRGPAWGCLNLRIFKLTAIS